MLPPVLPLFTHAESNRLEQLAGTARAGSLPYTRI
jgi:hypothetical protein